MVTPEGLPLAYEVMAGNTQDKATLRGFLAGIEQQYGKARRIWVMDRGIPTEEILQEMRACDPPVQYLVGTPKGRLTRYEKQLLEKPWHEARPGVQVKLLPQDGELYVLAQSIDRVWKERAIRRRKLKWLWKRLKELSAMQLTREELLMKLSGARSEAKAAWRLVIVEVAEKDASFSYRLSRIVEDVITRALDEGRVPTKSEILEAARQIRAERQGDKAENRAAREVDLANRITALPQRRYGVIVADPEWRFEPWSRQTGMDRAADNHYPTSCTEIIAARDVPSIAANDCILFLWATVPMLPHALTVMGGWGFDYRSHFVWVKNRIGTGFWNRNKHELLLVGVRGHIPAPAPGTQWESAINAPVGKHSEKPECFYQLVESHFPTLPKIELNCRGPARPGWDAWGNECLPLITADGPTEGGENQLGQSGGAHKCD